MRAWSWRHTLAFEQLTGMHKPFAMPAVLAFDIAKTT
jgi:hypothetical protein